MPGKTNAYVLGEFGVNRVKSPIHLLDGELLHAQNAEVPFEKGNRGLRKRSGLRRFTPVAAAGAILSMSLIPLTDPDPGLSIPPAPTPGDLFVPFSMGSGARTSGDGVTWSDFPVTLGNVIVPSFQDAIWSYNGTNLLRYDGVTQTTHGVPTGVPSWGLASADEDYIWWISASGLERFDPVSDTISVITAGPGPPVNSLVAGGQLFAGAGASVYRRSGGGWTLEHTLSGVDAGHTPTAIALYAGTGRAYFSTFRFTGVNWYGRIFERGSGGGWSMVYTTATRTLSNLVAGADALYCVAGASNPNQEVLRSTDGAVWTTDLVLAPTMFATAVTGALVAWGDDMFLTVQASGVGDAMLRRNGALGTWSTVDPNAYSTLPSGFGFL